MSRYQRTRTDQPPPGGRRAWNLLLLIPFVMLVTPLYNSIEPALFGLPFFYWFQLAWVPVTVACVLTVYLMTRGASERRTTAGITRGNRRSER